MYINSSRGGHGAPGNHFEALRRASSEIAVSLQSSNIDRHGSKISSSEATSRDGPPKVYEEMIQILEGDVRKHIRIE